MKNKLSNITGAIKQKKKKKEINVGLVKSPTLSSSKAAQP